MPGVHPRPIKLESLWLGPRIWIFENFPGDSKVQHSLRITVLDHFDLGELCNWTRLDEIEKRSCSLKIIEKWN